MTGAENLMNTVINTLSMIDKGFTVTLTVQPHDWYGDDWDYEEEDDDDDKEEPHVSDEVIEEIKGFARRVDEIMPEAIKSKVYDRYSELVKEKYSDVIRSLGDDVSDAVMQPDSSWPNVGDEVWYKTKHGNHERGKVKVVCHNTIQLDNNVTLERKDCLPLPFNVGNDCWLVLGGNVLNGIVMQAHKDNAHVNTKQGTLQMPYARLFDSVDDLLGYLKSTADE